MKMKDIVSGGATVDIQVDSAESIFLLRAVSHAGEAWIEDHVAQNYETQYWGDSIVVEHRFIQGIIDGARRDGLTVTTNFPNEPKKPALVEVTYESLVVRWYYAALTEKERQELIGHIEGAKRYGVCSAYRHLPEDAKKILRAKYDEVRGITPGS
jgi:hypothetical protein